MLVNTENLLTFFFISQARKLGFGTYLWWIVTNNVKWSKLKEFENHEDFRGKMRIYILSGADPLKINKSVSGHF